MDYSNCKSLSHVLLPQLTLFQVWQAIYLGALIGWTLWREWQWPHTVFFVLHGLVFIMKQHSYAFYNGYLSEAYKTREVLRRRLKQLENTSPVQTPSANTPAIAALETSYLDHKPTASELNQRRYSTSLQNSSTDITLITSAITSGELLDLVQIQTFERIIKWEVDALSEDIKGKSSSDDRIYPNNLTLANHYEYIVLPSLVYELEYPRSDKIDWSYVAEKAAATIGVLLIMQLVSQTFIYPVVVRTIEMKDAGMSLQERLMEFPWILSDLVMPFMLEYMVSLVEAPMGTLMTNIGNRWCGTSSGSASSTCSLNSLALRIVGSTATGGTVYPGTNSRGIGTARYTTSSFVMYITLRSLL